MSETIPTTESIKALVAWAAVQDLPDDERTAPKMAEARRRFDRWLASVERAAAEKAWDEGIAALEDYAAQSASNFIMGLTGVPEPQRPVNPYRAEAYRQERGEQ